MRLRGPRTAEKRRGVAYAFPPDRVRRRSALPSARMALSVGGGSGGSHRRPLGGQHACRPYDAAGHRRSPVTMPGFHEGRAPRNEGRPLRITTV